MGIPNINWLLCLLLLLNTLLICPPLRVRIVVGIINIIHLIDRLLLLLLLHRILTIIILSHWLVYKHASVSKRHIRVVRAEGSVQLRVVEWICLRSKGV